MILTGVYGDILTLGLAMNRFWAKVSVDPVSACWIWTGATNKDGYGLFDLDRTRLVHRIAYEWFIGPIPDGLFVLHSCDRPACTHPRHLFLGNQLANMTDKVQKGRQAKGERNGWARLTELQVREILVALKAGQNQREIALRYGVTNHAISHINRGRTWAYLKTA